MPKLDKQFKRIGKHERAEIERLLRSGESQAKVAIRFGRTTKTISLIAREEGIKPASADPHFAAQARQQYDTKARLEVLNLYFDKAKELVAACESAQGFRDLSIALGILIDKRRLEDGLAPGGGAQGQLGAGSTLNVTLEVAPSTQQAAQGTEPPKLTEDEDDDLEPAGSVVDGTVTKSSEDDIWDD